MNSCYVVGGQQRSPRPIYENDQNWYEYQKGIILRVDVDSGVIVTCVEYQSPSDACAPGDPILFKAGSIQGDQLHVSTQTEVLTYALPDFQRVGYVSLPCFNDVHHVRATPEGNLLVANSGLEMVLEVSPCGQILREWNVLGEDPWARFSKDIDYRKGINLKPHRAHPNYVFVTDHEIWATRFEKKDALCLTVPDRRIDIGLERIHDGFLHEGRVYFTTVNGCLVITNPDTQSIDEVIDLKTLHDEETMLGWCRGLFLEEGKAWIGFSRIRPTKFREAVRWARLGFKRELPTHIACYDLARKLCLMEINVEDYGLNAVFSILPSLNHHSID